MVEKKQAGKHKLNMEFKYTAMNATLKIYTIILFALLVTGCSEDVVDKVSHGTITGKVVKHGTNEPLHNIKITTAPTTQTIFSAEDGTFELNEVAIGDYAVKAEGEGYIMEIETANLKSGEQTISLIFEMKNDESLNTPPSAANLLTPVDNATGQQISTTLSWAGIDPDKDDVLKYRILIRNSKNNEIVEVKDLKETSYVLENLIFATDYFWQVVTNDGINKDVFSATYKFSTAAFPTNRFHYVRKEGANLRIFTSDEKGNASPLTAASSNSFRPKKSNAANLVAFLGNTNGNTHLFTSKPDGSSVFQVSNIPVAGFDSRELSFSWSANGKELIYPNFDKLYRVNKDGSGTELVYQTNDGSFISECAWSNDQSKIALKTNNISGYNVKIIIYDLISKTSRIILDNVKGAAGSLDFSVNGNKLLYTYDISGHEETSYRQLDTHIFIYDLTTGARTDLSKFTELTAGYIDVDARFSPNEGQIIFTQKSNDGLSQNDVYTISMNVEESRKLLFSNAAMPDWE